MEEVRGNWLGPWKSNWLETENRGWLKNCSCLQLVICTSSYLYFLSKGRKTALKNRSRREKKGRAGGRLSQGRFPSWPHPRSPTLPVCTQSLSRQRLLSRAGFQGGFGGNLRLKMEQHLQSDSLGICGWNSSEAVVSSSHPLELQGQTQEPLKG